MKLETFFNKFDQFADAPNAVAKMRELVLQLAVQGLIVPQSAAEGCADDLLARIATRNSAEFAWKNYVPVAPP